MTAPATNPQNPSESATPQPNAPNSANENPDAGRKAAQAPDAGAPVTPAPATDEAAPESRLSDELIETFRGDIAGTIKRHFPILLYLTMAIAVILIVLIAVGFFTGRTMDTAVLAASIQVGFGMVIGFECVYIGLMMTWFGIDASYKLKAGASLGTNKIEGALHSASPGLLFALGGIMLIAVSLYKPIVYQKGGTSFSHVEDLGDAEGTNFIAPIAPKTMPPGPSIKPPPQSPPLPARDL